MVSWVSVILFCCVLTSWFLLAASELVDAIRYVLFGMGRALRMAGNETLLEVWEFAGTRLQ